MSSAGWLKIAAEGVQDVYINGTPDVSYFTTIYKSHSSFLLNTFEVPFNNPPLASGGNAICRIPYKGDFLRGLSLKVNLPSVYTPGPGWIKTLRYSPSIQFNFTDGSNVIVNAQQTPSNIFATYNEISSVAMALSNLQGSLNSEMFIYGTPYIGLVRTSNVIDTEYIVSNLITQQYVEPVTTVTHINFANCIANATTTNITNAILSPVTSLYVTPVNGMNVFNTGYTGAVNVVNIVNSYGGGLFEIYVKLTSQQPKSFNQTVYYSNITTTYSTNPVTDLAFTYTGNVETLTDGMLVYNTGLSGTVTANIYNSTDGKLNFTSQPPTSFISNTLSFVNYSNVSTEDITQTQFTVTSTPSFIANSIFPGMNIFFANTTFNVTSTPNVASVSGSVVSANIITQQPLSESGTMFISNIVATTNLADINTTLLEFTDGPYGGLTYGNVYGLPFTANVATVFPSAISVNVSSRQPFSFTNPVNVFFSTTTSNLSTVNITTSNIAFFSPTGVPAVNDVLNFTGGLGFGTATVLNMSDYPSDVTVTISSQQPQSFSNLSVTYNGGQTATVSTLNVSRLEMLVSNLIGPDPSSILYANIQGTTNLGGHILPYWGPVQNVISFESTSNILNLSFPPQQPVSFQNNFTVYAFTSARVKTANITTAVYSYTPVSGDVLASVGQYVSNILTPSQDYITAANATSLVVTFPPRQPFVKNNFLSYISPYSNMSYTTTPITSATLNLSNTFGVINKNFTMIGVSGSVTPSNVTTTTMIGNFEPQQPFSFTNTIVTFQTSSAIVTTNTISNTLVTVNSGGLVTGATPNYSMLRTSNSSLIGTLSNVVTINAAAISATLTFPSVQQPVSVSDSVYVGYAAQATTNLLTESNVQISGVLGTGATIQVGANVLGMGYTGIATVAEIISSNTLLKLTLSTPQQPASYSNIMFFSPSQADFTSPSSIPWLTFPKLTAQNVTVFYNQTTQKWNFKSFSKPIANLAFTSYDNMVFWGFDPRNRA
jgi:hypothetical protein